MAVVVGARVIVTDVATLVVASDKQAVVIRNLGTASIDLGGSGVTSGTGYPLGPGESVSIDLIGSPGAVYGIAAAGGSVAVAALKVGAE